MNIKTLKYSLSSWVIRGYRKNDSNGKRNEIKKAMSWLPGKAKGGKEGFKYIPVLVLSFPLRRLDRRSEPCKSKTHLFMSLYTYLALRISNHVGAKLSCWRLGTNSLGANWDLGISCTQRGHCCAGAKLSRSYFGIISSRRQLCFTYKF